MTTTGTAPADQPIENRTTAEKIAAEIARLEAATPEERITILLPFRGTADEEAAMRGAVDAARARGVSVEVKSMLGEGWFDEATVKRDDGDADAERARREARAQEEASTHAEMIDRYGFSIGGSPAGGRVDELLKERLHSGDPNETSARRALVDAGLVEMSGGVMMLSPAAEMEVLWPKDTAADLYQGATESINAELTRQLGTEGQATEPPVIPEPLKSMPAEKRAGFIEAFNAASVEPGFGAADHIRRDTENTTTFEAGSFEAFLEVISHHRGSTYVSVVDAGSGGAIVTGLASLFRGGESANVHVRCKDGHRLIAKNVPFADGAPRAITLLKLAAAGAFFNDMPDVASVETYAAKFGQGGEMLVKVPAPGDIDVKVSMPTDAYPFSDMDLSAEMQIAPELGLSPVQITVVTTISGSVRYARETGTPEVVAADRAKLRELYEREAAAIGWSHASRAKTPFERPSLMASIMAVRKERQRREDMAELDALVAEAEREVKRVEGLHAAYINGAPWIGDPPDLLGALKKRSALRERAEKIGGSAHADVAPQAKQDAARLPLDEEIYQRGVDWMATFPPSGPPSREAWKLSSSLIRHAHERIGQRSLTRPGDPISTEETPPQTPEAESLRLVAGRMREGEIKAGDVSREASSALLFAADEIDRLSAERAAVIEHLGHGGADVDAAGVARDWGLVEGIKRRIYLAVEACAKNMIDAHERDLGRAVFIAKISERARFSLRLHGATEEDVSGGHELPDTDTFRAAARSLFASLTPWTLSCLELAARGPGGPTPGTVIDLYQGVVSGLIRPKFDPCALALWPASDMLRATPKCAPRPSVPPHDDDAAARRLIDGLLAPLERGEELDKCDFSVVALALDEDEVVCARCGASLRPGDLILMGYEPRDQEAMERAASRPDPQLGVLLKVITDVRCAECASLLLRKAWAMMTLERDRAAEPVAQETTAPAEASAESAKIEEGKPSEEG